MGAEAHLVVVNREVNQAATELKKLLARASIALVLLNSVLYRLLRKAVLQLERSNRQTVDEQAQIQREPGIVAAVSELPGDTEAVLLVQNPGLLIARRRCPVEQVDLMRSVLDPPAQHIDRAVPGDLTLQASQKLAPPRAVQAEIQQPRNIGLGYAQEH